VHLVGVIIRIYHDVWSPERQSNCKLTINSEMNIFITVENQPLQNLQRKNINKVSKYRENRTDLHVTAER